MNECPKMYAPKPKHKFSSKIIGAPSSKPLLTSRTPVIQNTNPEFNFKLNSINLNFLRECDLDLQKDFDEFSAKSEIFSILKKENTIRALNMSSSTGFSKTTTFTADVLSEDLYEDEFRVPIRSPNPLYKIKGVEENDDIICQLEFEDQKH